jgi:hypothetical protein
LFAKQVARFAARVCGHDSSPQKYETTREKYCELWEVVGQIAMAIKLQMQARNGQAFFRLQLQVRKISDIATPYTSQVLHFTFEGAMYYVREMNRWTQNS